MIALHELEHRIECEFRKALEWNVENKGLDPSDEDAVERLAEEFWSEEFASECDDGEYGFSIDAKGNVSVWRW